MRAFTSLVALLCLAGCARLRAAAESEAEAAPQPAPSGSAAAAKAEGAEKGHGAESDKADAGKSAGFALPFAWEVSKDEPLAKARSFVSELLVDNARQVAQGRSHFAPLGDAEHPRATVVTCADARVQAEAWDATAEGDDFTVRNLGNSVGNAVGSVEYGVGQLHTPVLLILGHTGCDAVKAALDHTSDLPASVGKELAGIKPGDVAKASKTKAWTLAVQNNVNAQVDVALEHFAAPVHRGELTVVGAVYDLKNEMGNGYGGVNIVNVNGNVEPARIKAFVKAVEDSRAAPDANVAVPEAVLEATRQLGEAADAKGDAHDDPRDGAGPAGRRDEPSKEAHGG